MFTFILIEQRMQMHEYIGLNANVICSFSFYTLQCRSSFFF